MNVQHELFNLLYQIISQIKNLTTNEILLGLCTVQNTMYLGHLKTIILQVQTSLCIIKERLPFTFNFYGYEIAPNFPLQLTLLIALDYGFSETKLLIINTNIMQ